MYILRRIKEIMKKAKIEVITVMNGTTQIFLVPTCDLGKMILESLQNPVVKQVSANYQVAGKSLANAFMIESSSNEMSDGE